jgi:hypothetical protein
MLSKKNNKNTPSVFEKIAVWEAERHLTPNIRTSVYISTPITTGPVFVNWLHEKGQYLNPDSDAYETSLKAEVILPNIQRATSVIELLRWHHTGLIISPTGLEVPGWNQSNYHDFWTSVLSRYAQRAIFLNGWEYSSGCTIEFEIAQKHGIDCVDEELRTISLAKGLGLIRDAIIQIQAVGGTVASLEESSKKLQKYIIHSVHNDRKLYKDEVLDHIACTANVAQFVSFAPGSSLQQRFCRINGYQPNHNFNSPEEAISALLHNATEKKVNIRSYTPETPEGNPFIKRLESVDEVMSKIRNLAEDKYLYTIVNEVIDECDGGVSGVSHRGVIEFAPDTTPRCVDDPEIETSVFPFEIGMTVLKTIYGFEPDLKGREGARVEFSIHPKPSGWRKRHTIIWQLEQRPREKIKTTIQWPNRFSRMLGDKTYGLILASSVGFSVPLTMVFCRRLFPFIFGESTGSSEKITRTSPETKEPGYYLSARGWHDPYAVLEGQILAPAERKWTPLPAPLSSVLIQQVVPAKYSGRALYSGSNKIEIRGVAGKGDAFMLGEQEHEILPNEVILNINDTLKKMNQLIGPCNIEWVFDGSTVWVVQVNNAKLKNQKINTDSRFEWVPFIYSKNRIEDFRKTVFELRGTDKGINVIGKVSPLSHLGEIAEIYDVPVMFSRPLE